MLIADPQTVRVILRTATSLHCRRGRGTDQYLFLHTDYGRQVVALDVSVSETPQLPPAELRDVPKWQPIGPNFAALFESALYRTDRVHSNEAAQRWTNMTQLKAAPLGLALGFLSVLMANAADLPPPMAYPVYVPPPAFTWAGP